MEITDLSHEELQLLTEGKFTDWIKSKITGKKPEPETPKSGTELEQPPKKDSFVQKAIKKVKSKLGISSVKVGDIIVFDYRAKGWEEGTLHFFDQFPLTIVTYLDSYYMMGINIHYTPIRERKRFVKYLKDRYPSNFETDDKVSFPGFSFKGVQADFPFIADACIHKYIRRNMNRITIISPKELESLSWIDTSKFIFGEESKIKSDVALWRKWKDAKSFQQRTQSSVMNRVV